MPSKKEKIFFYKCPTLTPECEIEPFYKNYFPRDKDELRKIKGLHLQYSIIDNLPDEFGNLTELEFLCVVGLKKFPNPILKLKKLKWLELYYGKKSYGELLHKKPNVSLSLPKEFAQLSNLVVLWLQSYDLGKFPKVIFKFEKLYALSLYHCGLSSIPRGFECLSKQLGIVILDYNPLKNVPRSLYKFSKLWRLWLKGCGLNTLPKRLVRLRNLQELHLPFNDFAEFPQVIFEFENLEEISINLGDFITPEVIEKLNSKGIELK